MLVREVNSRNSSHLILLKLCLALTLFVFRICANNPDNAETLNHLTLIANGFNRWFYLHRSLLLTEPLFDPFGDSTATGVVGGNFHPDSFPGEQSCILHFHFRGQMGTDLSTRREFQLEDLVGQQFHYLRFDLRDG